MEKGGARQGWGRRVRSTAVEIIVEEAYWDPEGYQAYKLAMFNNDSYNQ